MRIDCERHGLLEACRVASSVISGSTVVKPVLANFLLNVSHDSVTVTAMSPSMEYGVCVEVKGVAVTERGVGLVSASKLTAILREMPDDRVLIEVDMDAAMVKGAASEFELPTDDPAKFPDMPQFKAGEDAHHRISAERFRWLVSRTTFAVAAAAHSRFGATTGVRIRAGEDGAIEFAATDGRQAAIAEAIGESIGGHSTSKYDRVVPPTVLTLAQQCLVDDAESVLFAIKPESIVIRTDRATIYARLIEGRFPDVQATIPKRYHGGMTVTPKSLAQATKQASLMAGEGSRRVVLSIDYRSSAIQLRAQGADVGRASVGLSVSGRCDDADVVTVSLSSKFLGKALAATDDAEMDFMVPSLVENKVAGPVVFTSPGWKYILVPIFEVSE